jgi:transposase InsO family protein
VPAAAGGTALRSPIRVRHGRLTWCNAASPRARPDAVWVADFTYVAAWSGTVHVAFVLDAHSRRILAWRASTAMKTGLVLDALEHAI